MRTALLLVPLLTASCAVRDGSGQWYVIYFGDPTVDASTTCNESFFNLECPVDDDDGFGLTTTSTVAPPAITVLLLDGEHDCPNLVIDGSLVYGEPTDDGFTFAWEGRDDDGRQLDLEGDYRSTYNDTLSTSWEIRFTETDERGIYDVDLSETLVSEERGSFTDQVPEGTKLSFPVPDPGFWPLNFLDIVKKPQGALYDPFEDSCEGDTCSFTYNETVTLEAPGMAKFLIGHEPGDEFEPFYWGNSAGVNTSTWFPLFFSSLL